MLDRAVFGYVVSIDGGSVTLNLRTEHRGSVASHREGVSTLLEIGNLFGVLFGSTILVLRVVGLKFSEPREVHTQFKQPSPDNDEPLRHLIAITIGRLTSNAGNLEFIGDGLVSPPLGAQAFPLSDREVQSIHAFPTDPSPDISLGYSVRGIGELRVPLNHLLPRHVAVLGGTGQGKSCFTAAMLQQMVKQPNPRIVVFDINGEYEQALKDHLVGSALKITSLGQYSSSNTSAFRIPYYALGRAGLNRLFLPSEKTQRPALSFALQSLPYLKSNREGAFLSTETRPCLFEDFRSGDATEAYVTLMKLRAHAQLEMAKFWPHMSALSCVVADSQCVQAKSNSYVRDSFLYSNVAPLITRIQRRIDDDMFKSVIDVDGGQPILPGSWQAASDSLVDDLFGTGSPEWKVQIINLRGVAHDLLPGILGALLELYAYRLFSLGQGNCHPTLLVLEEAHHYLRSISLEDGSQNDALAYERLAKEGRKFGLSMWISTQRPCEVSSTVLSQCGTWVCFRITGSADINAVNAATEWLDRRDMSAISGLPRQQALFFGCGVPLPTRIQIPEASPKPLSHDPKFEKWMTVDIPSVSRLPSIASMLPSGALNSGISEDDDMPF